MAGSQRTDLGRQGRTEGLITGFVLKIVREALRLTQEQLANELMVDPQTVQAWETGRRPLTATRVGALVEVRQRLRRLSAGTVLLDTLNDGLEADFIMAHALRSGEAVNPDQHPLARWVLTRGVSELLAWPFTGEPPSTLRGVPQRSRRGPVALAPAVSSSDRKAFFSHFRAAAEESLGGAGGSTVENVLLRRQAYYHLAWSQNAETKGWLETIQRKEQRDLPRSFDEWSPKWVAARSLAVALARMGDKESLRDFIHTGLSADETEAANLRYWAYWVGEKGTGEHTDDFMTQVSRRWFGEVVLHRLHDGLAPENACVDLYAHSICALLKREAYLLERDKGLCRSLRGSVENVLSGSEISPQTRKELEELMGFIKWISST